MRQLSSAGQQALLEIAQRQGFSPDAVMHMLDAVVRGNGGMAQFNHQEFSGGGQWMRGGMTMVSDMFNNHLKGRVNGLCSELANLVAQQPDLLQAGSFQSQNQGVAAAAVGWASADAAGGVNPAADAGLFAPAPPDWWGPSLRYPNSTGAQNGARYAYFAQARRLAVDAGGSVFIYDTLDHQIGGFSQQQGTSGAMSCTSQYGTVVLNSLPVVSINGVEQVPLPAPTPAAPPSVQAQASLVPVAVPGQGNEVLAMIQKLADLHAAGVLTADEFGTKKAELLGRL